MRLLDTTNRDVRLCLANLQTKFENPESGFLAGSGKKTKNKKIIEVTAVRECLVWPLACLIDSLIFIIIVRVHFSIAKKLQLCTAI